MALKKVTKHQITSAVKKNGNWVGYIAPNKVSEFHVNQGFHLGVQTNIQSNQEGILIVNGQYTFSQFVDQIEAYNCNSEVGTRVAYWEVTQ
ncbi:hypothetical protein [Bacillus toyonensis]|uniref:hypothetical protein n=1 Tax=Bacillus toyonensis TaxID=155322 RepID=UPI000BF89C4D|nr:hypothetical protein [Bacillus toyonensis]PGF05162.1 hypothetical protein COM61_01695 [Bacillus toyonensis]